MSSSAPPSYNVSVFIPSFWATANTNILTQAYADANYLKFPSGQGTESIPNLIVTGTTSLGTTTVTAPSAGDNSTRVPSTAWVTTAIASSSAGTATNLANGIASQIPYQTSANNTSFIANGTSGQYLQSNGTSAPSFATLSQSIALNNLYIPFYPNSGSNGVTNGLLYQTCDPALTDINGGLSLNSGILMAIYLNAGSVLTNVMIGVQTAGNGTWMFALYNGAGARLAVTASVANTATGNYVTAFASAYTVPTSGFYYLGVVTLTGATQPLCFSMGGGYVGSSVINYPNNTPSQTTGNLSRFRVCSVALTATGFPASLVSGYTIFSSANLFYLALN
jgi:hypothetical protein